MCGSGKALPSEFGWFYLANDRNRFLDVYFGDVGWSASQAEEAAVILEDRVRRLSERSASYLKLIVPEKMVIYPEYLPRSLQALPPAALRPAHVLSSMCPDVVIYLDKFLCDAKSYGQLYFRGDSHPTWLGSYLIYRRIIDALLDCNLIEGDALSFDQLRPVMAQYGGDLYTQTDPILMKKFTENWSSMNGAYGIDVLVKLEVPAARQKARRVEAPKEYGNWFKTRESLVYESQQKQLPRAVIFRDSTSQFLCDYLSQHFSRSAFIWHQGQVVREVVEREAPDVVIQIMAERFVTRYPSFCSLVSADAEEMSAKQQI